MSSKKRFFRALSAATALTMIAGTGSLVGAALLGDANNDGQVGNADIRTLGSYIVGSSDNISTAADMNADGNINVFDMVMLRRQVLQNPVTDVNYIHLNSTSITTEGSNMELNAAKNVVTITASGSYYVDGDMTDGQIIVNVPDETADAETVKIFLNGVSMTGSTASPIFVENAANTSINLVEGTTNTLSDGSAEYSDDYLECAVLHSKDDMTIKGSGTLNITANTQYAIHCSNDLKINGGNINITTSLADAVRGKTSVTVKDGNITIDSAGDGIKSTKGDVSITGGKITIAAENDAVQAETNLAVSGGEVYAYGARSFTAGTDYTVDITGGTAVGTSKEEFTNTAGITVNSMLLNYTERISKQKITINKNGSEVYSVTPEKKYNYALICNAALENGTYTVYTGDSQMTHDAAATEGEFIKAAALSTFNNVAAIGGTVVTTDNTITLSSSGITFLGSGASVSSDKNTVTISEPGTYIVKGEMEGGQIVVDVDKTTYADGLVELSLEGMSLTNTSTSPIYIASIGDKCAISAKNGTTNTVSDGSSAYTNADDDSGAIYSKDDLTFKGKGTLIVNGNYQDAVVSKDDIKINNGTLQINAADDGIRGKDSVTIGNADDTDFSILNVTVNAEAGDGIKSTNTDTTSGKGCITVNGGTVNITAYSDAMHASQLLNVNNGDLTLKTTAAQSSSGGNQQPGGPGSWGGSSGGNQQPGGPGSWGGSSGGTTTTDDTSAKGVKAGCTDDSGTTIEGTINIYGGNFDIDTTDDSIHATNVNIIGGNIKASTGDDGIHADQDLVVGTEGKETDYSTPYIDIIKSYEGLEGSNITQYSGTVMVTSSDDGYNAAGGTDSSGTGGPGGWNQGGSMGSGDYNLTINGGYTYVNAAGDGLDSNGNLTVNGGYVFVSQTGGGNSPIDCDNKWSYNGGVVVAGGSSDMFSESIPATYSFLTTSQISAGTTVTFTNNSGNVIATMTFANASQEMVMCSPESSVTCYTGGTVSGAEYFSVSSANSSMKAGYGGTISGGTTVSASTSGGGGGQNPWG